MRRRPLAPGPTQGGIRAARGPRGQDTGGRVVVMETVWWCESVPIQAVKCDTVGQHTHLLKEDKCWVSASLQQLAERHDFCFNRVLHIKS